MEGEDSIKEILFSNSKYSGIKWTLPILYNILILFTIVSTPKVTISTQTKIETMTPTPTPVSADNKNYEKNKITSFTTTVTTITLYYAGYSSTITTTDSKGELTTYATYIPPSTVLVVKTQVADAAMLDGSDSTTLHDFNGHSLLGIIMSLVVVTITLIFMMFS